LSNSDFGFQVEYTAGPEIGFVAKIKSNEPYLKNNANPADVMYNVDEPPRNSFMRQQQPNGKNEDIISDQMKEHIMSMFDSQEQQLDNRFVNNMGNRFMKPILLMISKFTIN